ncbi:SulP family inorganic anion transporter [Labilibaculum sp. K2S]|uniref:SulP family inorganic anion transporter n=1 Tax=Labilibaculum sp. K2S TaxID=3056386 RepID=UPI0025A4155F|nr:SulP family inorganic anion transporter [Labilibaculum sp. K2S]MDM8159308.1 SulP family inorganic anion transporter [Labilibaculum sp. K2S]
MVDFFRKKAANSKDDILSGLTVALALVPEAVAFAFVAGVDPLVGLYAAFMVGLITSVFGGRPGMISGATGAMAVVLVSLVKEGNDLGMSMANPVQDMGLNYLFATIILAGVLQFLAGVFKFGKFVRLIPHPVMMGFVNGLAIVIFMSQLGMFPQVINWDAISFSDYTLHINREAFWVADKVLYTMVGLVILTMSIMYLLPKITSKIPAALVAILTVSAIVIFGNLDVSTVGSFIRDGGGTGLKGGLPAFQSQLFAMVPFNWTTVTFILPYAVILAAIGLIESLMTLNLLDEITNSRGNGNRECMAQGAANIVTGFFGGMGGCAMIGQSLINVKSGGRGRLSGIIAASTLLVFILFASPYIEMVPIAALVGVMFMVVIGTFAWSTFNVLFKIPKADAFVLVLVSGLTVIFDLAIAVLVGVIVSALAFSWENARRIRARRSFREDGTKIYEIWGPLFFGSITTFNNKFDVENDPESVEIDFIESRVADHSGIEAISNLVQKYENAGKTIKLKHLSDDCITLLQRADDHFRTVILRDIDDPRYYVVTDKAKIG